MIEEAQFIMSIMLLSAIFINIMLMIPLKAKSNKEKVLTYLLMSIVPIAVSWMIALLFSYMQMTPTLIWCEIGLALMMYGYSLYRMEKKNKKAFILFVLYLVALLIVTVAGRINVYKPWVKLGLLDFTMMNMAELEHLIQNTVMFMPFGLIPLINEKYGFRSAFCAVPISIMIETTQLMLSIGECDISDVIGNSAGMILGVALAKYYIRRKKCRKSVLPHRPEAT